MKDRIAYFICLFLILIPVSSFAQEADSAKNLELSISRSKFKSYSTLLICRPQSKQKTDEIIADYVAFGEYLGKRHLAIVPVDGIIDLSKYKLDQKFLDYMCLNQDGYGSEMDGPILLISSIRPEVIRIDGKFVGYSFNDHGVIRVNLGGIARYDHKEFFSALFKNLQTDSALRKQVRSAKNTAIIGSILTTITRIGCTATFKVIGGPPTSGAKIEMGFNLTSLCE